VGIVSWATFKRAYNSKKPKDQKRNLKTLVLLFSKAFGHSSKKNQLSSPLLCSLLTSLLCFDRSPVCLYVYGCCVKK
jgi:hypothetical protein